MGRRVAKDGLFYGKYLPQESDKKKKYENNAQDPSMEPDPGPPE
jgi:hypothetical protein